MCPKPSDWQGLFSGLQLRGCCWLGDIPCIPALGAWVVFGGFAQLLFCVRGSSHAASGSASCFEGWDFARIPMRDVRVFDPLLFLLGWPVGLGVGNAPVKFGWGHETGQKNASTRQTGGTAGQARLLARMVIEGMSIHEKP